MRKRPQTRSNVRKRHPSRGEYPKILDILLILVVFPIMATGTSLFLVDAFCKFCNGDGAVLLVIPISIFLWAVDVGILVVWRTRHEL